MSRLTKAPVAPCYPFSTMKKRTVILLLDLLLPLAACNPNPRPTPEPVPRPRPATTLALEPTPTQPLDYYLLNPPSSPTVFSPHPTSPPRSQHPAILLHHLPPQHTTR